MKISSIYFCVIGIVCFFSCGKNKTNELSKVIEVYPTSDTLPQNLLRMYVQFSKPMKTIGNLEKIKLLDAERNEVPSVFFNNVHELWDVEQKQLTLILDPARVKSGLQVNESMGRALQPEQSYQLIISDLEDIHHQKIIQPFAKEFYVSKADTLPPNIDQWKVISPTANTKKPSTIIFPEMVDQMSLHQRLAIMNEREEIIQGSIDIRNNEKEWQFTPREKWNDGSYFVYINTRLADPCGNNLNGLFDHKAGSLKYEKEGEIIKIQFQVHMQ